jgi:hypothetical protein
MPYIPEDVIPQAFRHLEQLLFAQVRDLLRHVSACSPNRFVQRFVNHFHLRQAINLLPLPLREGTGEGAAFGKTEPSAFTI